MSFLQRLFGAKKPQPPADADEQLPRCGDLDGFEQDSLDGHPVARVGHLILTQALNDGADSIRLVEGAESFLVQYELERGWDDVMTPPKHIFSTLLDYLSSIAGCEYSTLLQQPAASGTLTYQGSPRPARLQARRTGNRRELEIRLG